MSVQGDVKSVAQATAAGTPAERDGDIAPCTLRQFLFCAAPFDVPGVEFGHRGMECSFDALVKKHQLGSDPAVVFLAKIVNGADTDNSLWNQAEAAGPNARLAETARGHSQASHKPRAL